MRKILLSLIVTGLIMISTAGFAQATTYYYNFVGGSLGSSDSQVWSYGGLDMTVTAWTIESTASGDILGMTQITGNGTTDKYGNQAGVYSYNDGLGLLSQYDLDNGESPYGNIDGDGVYEGLMFSFDSTVEISRIDFGEISGGDNFNLTIDNTNYLKDQAYGISSPWITYYDTDEYYFSGLHGKDFLIWIDDSIGENHIDNITFSPVPTPEPSTMILLGSGLIGVWRLRKKAVI